MTLRGVHGAAAGAVEAASARIINPAFSRQQFSGEEGRGDMGTLAVTTQLSVVITG